jgi:hypothetical protein
MSVGGYHNIGCFDLVSTPITTAVTAAVQNVVNNLDGMSAVTLVAVLTYTSGGTTAAVKAQTTLDNGVTWLDIAEFNFTTSAATFYANISGVTNLANTTYAALGTAGVNASLLGNQLRGILTTTGTYVGTNLTLFASVR